MLSVIDRNEKKVEELCAQEESQKLIKTWSSWFHTVEAD